MPQIVEPPQGAPEPAPGRIRWTRAQCEAIRDAGVLTGRYELIDGEIISKMGQNPPHSVSLVLVREYLAAAFGGLYVRIQATVGVADADPEHNDPEPDAAVTREPVTAYVDRHPGPTDVVLLVEVSDSTVRFDRTKKAALYARAGIGEYWVVDLPGQALFVHRLPTMSGYTEITRYAAREQAAPLARPDAAVRVEALLPPA